ncbi:MAG TPA: pyruvate kinase [Beutenbergiaceae bacterium]|nr:pyruvate kinase [Beutenbergiaceae bacterium]
MRRAKIVATIGPATESSEQIRALIDAGMNVARINRSHGDEETHTKVFHRVREAAEESGKAVAILVDLQGPKIRLGRFIEDQHELAEGDILTITTDDVPGTKERVSTTFKGLPEDVSVGDIILIDDGRVSVKVLDVTDTDVKTEVVIPGPVSNNKGLNLPGVAVNVPALSEKDADDLRWGLKMGADYIALSFVRSARDYEDVAKIMDEEDIHVPVIAKVEKPQAVDNLQEIVESFDGVMVARGDLGVELPLEEVPLVQKRAVELCQQNAKPVIVATQVLESMISSPRPTRAEASDCANAVLDGADAVMLSGETSVGAYPIESVQTMARIIERTEEGGMERIARAATDPHTQGGVISKAATEVATVLGARYLATFTKSGDTARRMARLRSETPLLVFTPVEKVRNQLALTWGVVTYKVDEVHTTEDMVELLDQKLLDTGAAQKGDAVVVISGAPLGVPGTTNALQIREVGGPTTPATPASFRSLDL